MIVLPLKGAS